MSVTISAKLKKAGLERREVSAVLRFETHYTKHYCMFCESKTPLWASQGRIFSLIYGNSVEDEMLTLPISVQCKECGTLYFIRSLNQ